MNWLMIVIAGLFETAFAICLGKARATTGATATWWLLGFLVCLIISMVLLYKATQTLPIGTAYAVWTGIGAVGSVVAGILLFHEPASALRLLFLTTLIASIIGLKFVTH